MAGTLERGALGGRAAASPSAPAPTAITPLARASRPDIIGSRKTQEVCERNGSSWTSGGRSRAAAGWQRDSGKRMTIIQRRASGGEHPPRRSRFDGRDEVAVYSTRARRGLETESPGVSVLAARAIATFSRGRPWFSFSKDLGRLARGDLGGGRAVDLGLGQDLVSHGIEDLEEPADTPASP